MISMRPVFLAIIALFCLVLASLFFWNFDSEYETNRALDYYNKGDWKEAAQSLEKAKPDLDPAQYHLYSAYIVRGKSLQKSNDALKKALEFAQKNSQNKGILLEIYLNQALNSYLAEDPESMESPLERAKSVGGATNEWVQFFISLQDYLKGHYTQALKVWKKKPNAHLSLWMQATYERLFTPEWFFIHTARANIEEGNFFQIRQKLDEESKHASEKKLQEINLLLGLSYIKEASEKPPSAALPYYRLGFSYLNRIPMLEPSYQDVRDEVLKKVAQQIKAMMDAGQFEEFNFYAEILKKWDSEKKYSPSAEKQLLDSLNAQIALNNWKTIQEIGTSLNTLVVDKEQRHLLQQEFENHLHEVLKTGNLDAVEKYLNLSLLFSGNPEELKRHFSDEIAIEIFPLVSIDTTDLHLTMPYLSLWNNLVEEPQVRLAVAMEMADLGQDLWIRDNQTEKAINLFKVGYLLSPEKEKEAFKASIANRLKHIYENGLVNAKEGFLKPLMSAKNELQLSDQLDFHEKEDAAKQLEEAVSLFQQGNLEAALKKATWALEVEPDNQAALSLAGQIDYRKTNYEQALNLLKHLKNLDEKAKEALAISEIITGDATQGQALLDQLNQEHPLDSEIYLRLGFGMLEKNKPEQSLQWFEKIPQPNAEATAGKAYAFFQMQQWQKALDAYAKLPLSMKGLNGMRNMALNSLLALGQAAEAEKLLQDILSQPENKNHPSFSMPLQSFKEVILDPQTPDFIAGMYFKNVKKDNQKALTYFRNVKPPSPLVLAERGEILYSDGKFEEAVKDLKKALEDSQQSPNAFEIKAKVLPILADSLIKQGDIVGAAAAYSEYFKLFPKETKNRSSYAQALIELRLFANACEQLKILEDAKLLSSRDKLNDIICLVHTNQFDAAREKASLWLAQEPPLSLNDQLKMAQTLIPVRDNELIDRVIKKVQADDKPSIEVQQSLLSFLISIGDYSKAQELAKSIEPELVKSFDGLFLLTQLNSKLSNAANAFKYGEKAFRLNPDHPKILELMEMANFDMKTMQEEIERIQKKLNENPDSLSLQLSLAQAYIDLAAKVHKTDPSTAFTEIPVLRTAYLMLDNLSKILPTLPTVAFSLGESAYLLNYKKPALDALQKAVVLDVSYVEAYKLLAMLYLDQGNLEQALEAIQKSIQYEPQDAQAWLTMALIYHKLESSLDALIALERAIQYNPNDPGAYVLLAGIKLELKNPEDAKTALEQALKLDPKNVEALKLMLVALHDPFLSLDGIKPGELKKQQNATYEAWHALQPKQAEEWLSKFKKANP